MEKTEIRKNIMENKYAAFLLYENLKTQQRIKVDEYCYPMHQFIMPSANSHCHFHILFIHHGQYFPTCIFTLYFPCLPFVLIDHNGKQLLVIK